MDVERKLTLRHYGGNKKQHTIEKEVFIFETMGGDVCKLC